MIEQLFGSKTRVKLLQLFFSNPNRSFYVREITRKIDEQINSVRRELANLLSIGIISSETTNNRLYYEVNQSYEHYGSLAAMFGSKAGPVKTKSKEKTLTVAKENEDLLAIGNVELAIYTGQFTRDDRSGIDLLIVGDVNATQLDKFISQLEEKEGKELRYAVMTVDDFNYRDQVNDRFVGLLREAKNQVLVDKHNLMGKK